MDYQKNTLIERIRKLELGVELKLRQYEDDIQGNKALIM